MASITGKYSSPTEHLTAIREDIERTRAKIRALEASQTSRQTIGRNRELETLRRIVQESGLSPVELTELVRNHAQRK